MLPDLSDIFRNYELLEAQASAVFDRVAGQYPDCVACHAGCDDCCHAVFDLSLVEAMHLNKKFLEKFPHGLKRSQIMDRASVIDRKLALAKRDLYQAEKGGESAADIMRRASAMRSPCPLLEDGKCLMYDERPITCRLYGIPLAIGGKAHVCGLSRFDPGGSYPTARLEKFQQRLEELSAAIAEAVNSEFDLHDVYVPLSMALLTKYDEKYLGVKQAKE